MPNTGVIFTVLAILAAIYMAREAFIMWRSSTGKKKFWVRFLSNDPLIAAAAEKARDTLPLFEELRTKYPRYASLALGPIKEDGDTLPVLIRRKTGEGYIVRRARNEKDGYAVEEGEEFAVKTADIVDWIVYESEKKDRIYGGFTLRAVVDIAERDGVPVPPHAKRQFEKFVDV